MEVIRAGEGEKERGVMKCCLSVSLGDCHLIIYQYHNGRRL